MNISRTGIFTVYSHVSDLRQKFQRLSYSCIEIHARCHTCNSNANTQKQTRQHTAKVLSPSKLRSPWSSHNLLKMCSRNLIFSWIIDVAVMQLKIIQIFSVLLSICSVLLRSFCVFAFVLQSSQCAAAQFISYCLAALITILFSGMDFLLQKCLQQIYHI